MVPKLNLSCTETVKTRIIFKQLQNSFPDEGVFMNYWSSHLWRKVG